MRSRMHQVMTRVRTALRCQTTSLYAASVPREGLRYCENAEVGPKNLQVKLERQKNGGPFEWPDIMALNQAVAGLVGDATKIVNIGAGTGAFESFAAKDTGRCFVASEFDSECVEWCKSNRSRPNVTYTSLTMGELLGKYGKFDLAVSIEVIEHVSEFAAFLTEFRQLADQAIITTPNRDRTLNHALASSPAYKQHVREWDAGEFYWILRVFYREVELYAMPDTVRPVVERVGPLTSMSPLIAVCRR